MSEILKNHEKFTKNSQKNHIKSHKILPQIAANFYQSRYARYFDRSSTYVACFQLKFRRFCR